MGRKAIGNAPMTATERQRRRRGRVRVLMADPVRRFRFELYYFLKDKERMGKLSWNQILEELEAAEDAIKLHQYKPDGGYLDEWLALQCTWKRCFCGSCENLEGGIN